MARKPLTGSVKLFSQNMAVAPGAVPAVDFATTKPSSVREMNKSKQSIFKKIRSAVIEKIEEPKVDVLPVTTSGKKIKDSKKKDGGKEYITAEDGLIRLELFSENIETLRKYFAMYETDMIARRVRNMLVLFIEFSTRIISEAAFEDASQKVLLAEKIAIAKPLIVKWDNLPDIADMVMNKVKKVPKDKK